MKKYSVKAAKFCHVFRFIQYLYAVNDNSEFEKNFKDIYSEELELKKGIESPIWASFLVLSVHI